MLETLADHDDQLMEQLLDEIEPPRDAVFDDLVGRSARRRGDAGADRHRRKGQRRAAPAEGDPPRCARCRGDPRAARRHGRQRRRGAGHEDHPHRRMAASCRSRASCPAASPTAPSSTRPTAASGKVSGIYRMLGKDQSKLSVRQGRRDGGARQARRSQDRRHAELGQGRDCARSPPSTPPEPVFAIALRPKERKDEVKLSAAHPAACRGRPFAQPPAPPGFRARRCCRAMARCICASSSSGCEGRNQIAGRAPCPGRPLSRDDPQAGHAARPPQEAVRRPRPVRRRRARHQAAAARQRLPVHRHHHRRRRAARPISPRSRPACATT